MMFWSLVQILYYYYYYYAETGGSGGYYTRFVYSFQETEALFL